MKSKFYQFVFSAALIISVSGICYLLSAAISYQTTALILLLTIAFLSLFVEIRSILFSALLSSLIWNFFFIPPQYTFSIGTTQDEMMFVSYFVIAIITGILTVRVRIREERAMALFTLTKELTSANTIHDVAVTAVNNISRYFIADVAIFLSRLDGDIFTSAYPNSMYDVDEKEFGVAAWVYWNEKKAGKFTGTHPSASATYFPITGPRYPLGVIGIKEKNNTPFTLDQESLLQNFIAQISSTLEREQLNELTNRTAVYAESEKLYRTLFNSISHELRTPIAAIISATESLTQNNQQEFVGEIQTAAERLNRLVENLLDMTRLESGQLAPKLDWCDVNDLIRSSMQKFKKDFSSHRVLIEIPEVLPLVKLDYGLMEQAFTNLLFNAVLYTPPHSTITLSAKIAEKNCIFTVSDNGPGFPVEALKHLFEKFYRVPGSRTGGTGLGLSIAKGFVEAHKGTITAANSPSGGAEFIITIPVETHLSIL